MLLGHNSGLSEFMSGHRRVSQKAEASICHVGVKFTLLVLDGDPRKRVQNADLSKYTKSGRLGGDPTQGSVCVWGGAAGGSVQMGGKGILR